eukprot:scaffold23647_cov51-Attheya_sp.AAC.4
MTAWMFRHLACLTFLLVSQGTEGSTKPQAATRYSDGSSSSHELVGRQGRPVVRRRRLDAEHDSSRLDDLNLELELEEQGDALLLEHPEEEEGEECHRNRSLLRVPCRVTLEGQHHEHHELETIVDTGAQVTVMTLEAVRKCRLLHLVDRRYAGHATGVGKVRVLGKLPAHTLHLLLGHHRHRQDNDTENSDDHPPQHARLSTGSIVVIESTGTPHMDLLIGLDLLDEWHATIRLGTSSPSLTLLRPNNSNTNNNQQDDKEEITIPFLPSQSQSHRKTRVVPQQQQRQHQQQQQQQQQQRHTASSSMFASPQSHKKFRHGRYASSSSSSRQTFQTRPVATPSSSSSSSHIPRRVMDCDLESDLDMLDSSSSSGGSTTVPVSSAPEFSSTTVATMESWDHEDDDDDDDDTYLDHDEDDPYGDVFDLSGV